MRLTTKIIQQHLTTYLLIKNTKLLHSNRINKCAHNIKATKLISNKSIAKIVHSNSSDVFIFQTQNLDLVGYPPFPHGY